MRVVYAGPDATSVRSLEVEDESQAPERQIVFDGAGCLGLPRGPSCPQSPSVRPPRLVARLPRSRDLLPLYVASVPSQGYKDKCNKDVFYVCPKAYTVDIKSTHVSLLPPLSLLSVADGLRSNGLFFFTSDCLTRDPFFV